jgi:hypothetical protein
MGIDLIFENIITIGTISSYTLLKLNTSKQNLSEKQGKTKIEK